MQDMDRKESTKFKFFSNNYKLVNNKWKQCPTHIDFDGLERVWDMYENGDVRMTSIFLHSQQCH